MRLVRVLEWGGGGHSGALLIEAPPTVLYSKERTEKLMTLPGRMSTRNSTRRRVAGGIEGISFTGGSGSSAFVPCWF